MFVVGCTTELKLKLMAAAGVKFSVKYTASVCQRGRGGDKSVYLYTHNHVPVVKDLPVWKLEAPAALLQAAPVSGRLFEHVDMRVWSWNFPYTHTHIITQTLTDDSSQRFAHRAAVVLFRLTSRLFLKLFGSSIWEYEVLHLKPEQFYERWLLLSCSRSQSSTRLCINTHTRTHCLDFQSYV